LTVIFAVSHANMPAMYGWNDLAVLFDETTTRTPDKAKPTAVAADMGSFFCYSCEYTWNSGTGIRQGSSPDCLVPTDNTEKIFVPQDSVMWCKSKYFVTTALNDTDDIVQIYMWRGNETQPANPPNFHETINNVQMNCQGSKCNRDTASDYITPHESSQQVINTRGVQDDKTTTTTEQSTTTKTTKTTTTSMKTTSPKQKDQCFACTQDDASENGPCWNPIGDYEMCDRGCQQMFKQIIKNFESVPDTYVTKIVRSCKSGSPHDQGAYIEDKDIYICQGDLCNAAPYSGAVSMLQSNASFAFLNLLFVFIARISD